MSREYCNYLIDLLGSWNLVTARAMFGGYGLYCKGQIFAIIVDGALYFKVDSENISDYRDNNSEPFSYVAKEKRVSLSYWQVPEIILDDSEMLASWVEKSYQAGVRSKKSKKISKN